LILQKRDRTGRKQTTLHLREPGGMHLSLNRNVADDHRRSCRTGSAPTGCRVLRPAWAGSWASGEWLFWAFGVLCFAFFLKKNILRALLCFEPDTPRPIDSTIYMGNGPTARWGQAGTARHVSRAVPSQWPRHGLLGRFSGPAGP
jgi:hypothetical protein